MENVTFCSPDTGFTVFDINCDEEMITAVGEIGGVYVGEQLSLTGYWDRHASFGRQFKVLECERTLPETAADMLRYLSSGTVKGIGPATAQKIVERFGEETFEIIENHPEELAKIKGISREKAEKIGESFAKQVAVRQVMVHLERYGMTPTECLNSFKIFGQQTVERVTENPYILCSGGVGIGFERACAIADKLPVRPDDVYRVRAGIVHVVRHNLHNGHTCIPRDKLVPTAASLLAIDEEDAQGVLDALVKDRQLCSENINGREFLFLPDIWLAEKNIADRMKIMLRFPPAGRPALEKEISDIERKNGIEYEEKQKQAIITAVRKGLLILTGGPGTGKTTTVNGILELFEKDGLDVVLTAPTGRAAKRMSDITGREAKTIHRLLEVEWGAGDRAVFQRNAQNPIEADAVIVDELSMVDVSVFAALLDALPLGCRLVVVGDSDQLPPVGAGNVLADLIGSGLLPVVALTEVFRQALKSLIVTNAHRIVRGEMPVLDVKDNDFFFLNRTTAFSAAETVTELCASRLPKAYGYDPISDIQVLCPSRKGETGTVNLNNLLQQALNPPARGKTEFRRAGVIFRTGDKVMQIKNNYDLTWIRGHESGSGVFNGDIGIITDISTANGVLKIVFDDRKVVYPIENADELTLAYACTVHKSQGSEFEAVILPVCSVMPQLSYRNLLYTAVTRAKTKLIAVGTREQLEDMVMNDKKTRRYSALKYFLEE